MEDAHTFLRTLLRSCPDHNEQLLDFITPEAVQNLSLESCVCTMLVKRVIKNVIVEPSTQIIHDLRTAWEFIVSSDNSNTSAISLPVDAASLNWIITATVAAMSAIDNQESCHNADQHLLLAVETLTRQVNCGLRFPQSMATHRDRIGAIAIRKRARHVLASFEETVVKKLMGNMTPVEMLDRVRLEPECPVCKSAALNSEENYAVLSGCTHALCVACARTWFSSREICPLCRAHGVFFKKSTLENLKQENDGKN